MLRESINMISSLQNALVKQVVRLKNRRERDKTKLFLIEGYREILRKGSCETLLFCPGLFLGSNESDLIYDLEDKGAEVIEVHEDVFRKMSYRDRPDGLIAIAKHLNHKLEDIKQKGEHPFYVIAESIEKPGNLGTILRSCDAAGVDGLIVCDRCTDIHNPNVVRASTGTLFTQTVVETTSEKAIEFLKKQNVKILAATPSADEFFTDVKLDGPIAIAVGTEQLGLSSKWMSELQVKIPMLGTADSLNVAQATTLLLYEVLRQRALLK